MKELDFTTPDNKNYLYTTDYNLVDFNVDDNGLWVIYSVANSNHTIVSMLNPMTLDAVYSLNISINHHKVRWHFLFVLHSKFRLLLQKKGKLKSIFFQSLSSGWRNVYCVWCFVCNRFNN